MNIHYVRAAIQDKVGVRLSLTKVRNLLVEEGLITPTKAKHSIFRGYSEFYDYFYKQDKNVVEVTVKKTTPLDVVEELNSNGIT